jgi:DNA-binding response OmpR family regulator/two-component sensor histidine kinase
VNDLLDISRIESGRVQLKEEVVDLKEIVQTVVATMQQSIEQKQQSLVVDIDPAATNVKGDRDKLVQVLTNYVSNAYKYTQAGGAIRVDVREQGGFAHIGVSDNGYGILLQDQERLFTRFYRVDNTMTREVGGTGLGLSIVKQLIELQGGEVGVESQLGEGSTFWFTIPLADQPGEKPAGILANASQPETAQPEATILIVEDDPDLAHLIAHHLQKAGYRVRVTHSAEEAWNDLELVIPDLITLDIQLPGIQGDEFASRLQTSSLTRDIPILILSVLVDDFAQKKFSAYWLPKPIYQEDLLAKVKQMLREHHQGPLLVIDDDRDVRKLLKSAFEKHGFMVETALDSEDGLAQAKKIHPSLILLDMHMPTMDGFAVLQALKAARDTADIPVIAMTGSPELKTNARARFLALGASDFITKPFDMERLIEEIHLFINAKEV